MIKFKKICNQCEYVDQSFIIVSKNALYTSHVGTCSVLLFSYNNLNFMAHIDALQNNSIQIIEKIKKHFNTTKLKNDITVYIIKGPWRLDNCYTTNIITKSLNTLNIKFNIIEKKIKWTNEIYINNNKITIS